MQTPRFPSVDESGLTTAKHVIAYRQMMARQIQSPEKLRQAELARLQPAALRYAAACRLTPEQWACLHQQSLNGADLNALLDIAAQLFLQTGPSL